MKTKISVDVPQDGSKGVQIFSSKSQWLELHSEVYTDKWPHNMLALNCHIFLVFYQCIW